MQERLSNASKGLYDGKNSVGRAFLLICGVLVCFPEHPNLKNALSSLEIHYHSSWANCESEVGKAPPKMNFLTVHKQ